MTLTEVQRLLLGIITSVESGSTTPKEAIQELNHLERDATASGLIFHAEYTLADFQNIREAYLSEYDGPLAEDDEEYPEEE